MAVKFAAASSYEFAPCSCRRFSRCSSYAVRWAFESAYDAQGTAADSAATTTVTSARSGRMRSNDHIFFTPGSLALRALRATAAEWNDDGDEPNYPNEEHPSDHLPIAAAFDFIC